MYVCVQGTNWPDRQGHLRTCLRVLPLNFIDLKPYPVSTQNVFAGPVFRSPLPGLANPAALQRAPRTRREATLHPGQATQAPAGLQSPESLSQGSQDEV